MGSAAVGLASGGRAGREVAGPVEGARPGCVWGIPAAWLGLRRSPPGPRPCPAARSSTRRPIRGTSRRTNFDGLFPGPGGRRECCQSALPVRVAARGSRCGPEAPAAAAKGRGKLRRLSCVRFPPSPALVALIATGAARRHSAAGAGPPRAAPVASLEHRRYRDLLRGNNL